MITAIVVMNCEVGKVHQVAEALTRIDAVAEVYSVSGDHDILAICKVSQYDDLSHVVTEQIGSIPGITRTSTQMAFRAYSKQDMEKVWAETMGE